MITRLALAAASTATVLAAVAGSDVAPVAPDRPPGAAGSLEAPAEAMSGAGAVFTASDSAVAELDAGRFWHASRVLRAEGADGEAPAGVLMLARAEAGWQNWSAVEDLLDGAEWLTDFDEGAGMYLLARAFEDRERWAAAAVAYGAYLDGIGRPDGSGDAAVRSPVAAAARLARALWRAGDRDGALSVLDRAELSVGVRSWAAVELAITESDRGDTTAVRALLERAVEPAAADLAWSAEAEARLVAGDSVGAARAYRTILAGSVGSRRAAAAVELGRLLVAVGDTVEARALLLSGLEGGGRRARARAAETIQDLGGSDAGLTLRLARVFDSVGDGRRALSAYDRVRALAADEGGSFPESARLERARLMSTVRSRQEEALEEFREIRETTGSARIGARNLEVWALMRARQGLRDHERTLRRWLLEEHPSSSEAVEYAYTQGRAAEDRGRLDEALARFSLVSENAPTHIRAGQARMRAGQIHLRRSDPERALDVFEAYLEDFPNGRRWQEASYWAGRLRFEQGDTARARRHLERALREQPIEYYAVMAAELLDVPFEIDLPEGTGPSRPGWLAEGLARLDLFEEAGLARGVTAEIERLSRQARGSRGAMLGLAEALIERGHTVDGINLGWTLLDDAKSWDRSILRVTFPFPYRELVRREAAEWGLDPIVMASIIRQESAFEVDIVSRAGAVGLMQVMPPTGAQLARTHGPPGFNEGHLTAPEVNLHLGAAFFVDMSARYDGDLPLVLSAYNAGPTRATRWRRYPEVADQLRFTERIPIAETRGYVKSVRRNLGLYRALYGSD